MNWKKEFGPDHETLYQAFSVLLLIAVIPALLLRLPLLFLIISLLLAFVLISRYYDKQIGVRLTLTNEKRTIRLFPGQQTDVKLTLHNESFLPIINGRLSFRIGQEVSSILEKQTRHHGDVTYNIPLSILRKGNVQMPIPVKAQSRGTTRFTNIRYDFPHPLNARSISLTYNRLFQTEIIVYPEPIPVTGLKEQLYLTPGEERTPYSPFENVLNPSGTRDYVQSDPFHRIHWKASAKKQTLQTKVYERTWHHSWSILINISSKSRLGNAYVTSELEKLLSYATYICHTLTEKNQPFELMINARKIGEAPYFYYLHEGQGKSHLRKSLDLLARLKPSTMLMPFSSLLHKIDQTLNHPKTIVVLGMVDDEDVTFLRKWQQNGMGILVLQETENGPVLTESLKEGDRYAQR